MANKGHGYLYILDEGSAWGGEVVNHARTAAYLESSTALGCGTVYSVLDDGGCEGYRWEYVPYADTWIENTFTTPALDNAPWYNPAYPESAQALGFWITEWTGLDSGHVKRTSTPIGAYRGGSTLGIASNAGRIMGIEMLLIAETEKAMEYLYQWFDATISSVCSTCKTDTILIRRYCPDAGFTQAHAKDGAAEIRGVGLVSGMIYGEDPVEQAGCFLRRVNFTLEATDPCMYDSCTGEVIDQYMNWAECFAPGSGLSPARPQCRPSCTEVAAGCRAVYDYDIETPSVSAPIITLEVPPALVNTGGTQSFTIPLRIRTYSNPYGYTASQLCGLPLLAELYLTNLPASSAIRYDMAARKVEYRDAASGDWVNGFAFVEANEPGTPRFAGLGCGSFTTVIEPSNFCVSVTGSGAEAGFPSNSQINSAAYHPTLGYIIGGGFTTVNGAAQLSVGAIGFDGRRVQSFAPVLPASSFVFDIVVQPDGKIILGGLFATVNGTTVNGIVRLLPNGTIDPTWNTAGTPGVDPTQAIYVLKLQPDGKILMGGSFVTGRNGTTQNHIQRLNADGTLDTGFNTGGTTGVNGDVFAIDVQASGKILVGGLFVAARGTTQNNIARLDGTTGALDATFNTGGTIGTNGSVRAIAVQPSDGNIVIGGTFTTARGTTVNRFARLLGTTGAIDTSYNVGGTIGAASGTVFTITLDEQERAVISGSFGAVRGTTTNGIARLTKATGILDSSYDITGTPGITGGTIGADAIVIPTQDPSDRIIIAGSFTAVRGTSRNYLARLSSNGALDTTFPATSIYYPGQMVPSSSLALQQRIGCV